MTPTLLAALLTPISPEQPGGTDIGYSTEFDAIRKLRKGDDPSLSQGEWVREIRTPQWPVVRDLCETILRTRSKDLQAACWYTESLAQLEGFPGLTFGLKVLEGLLARFEDTDVPTLYPADTEEQMAKLEWLNAELPMVIQGIPMTNLKTGGYSRLKWEESRLVENLGVRDPKAKEEALAEGKLSGEAWDKAARASGQTFYLNLFGQIQEAQGAFETLGQRVDLRFSGESPNIRDLRDAIAGCAELAQQMLRSVGLDPRLEASAATAPTLHLDAFETPTPTPTPGGPIASRAEAIRRLREVANYFREHEPHSPVGPLAERAARWGEMPLGQWLSRVVKDEATLNQLQELLDITPEL